MVRILGLLDIGMSFMLLARVAGWQIPLEMMIFFSVCLAGKALISLGNFFGWIDLMAIIILIISGFIAMPSPVFVIFAIVIGLKGIISMI
jgi:hypothetical protein